MDDGLPTRRNLYGSPHFAPAPACHPFDALLCAAFRGK